MSTINKSLAGKVITLLREKGLTLATAESCTGGLLSDKLTDIDGSSEVFLGGVVAYTARAKTKLGNVPEATISSYGTVSPQTTIALAEHVRDGLGATIGVGITGVAGTSTEGKTTGVVYICLASRGIIKTEECLFKGSRRQIKLQAVQTTLGLLMRAASGEL